MHTFNEHCAKFHALVHSVKFSHICEGGGGGGGGGWGGGGGGGVCDTGGVEGFVPYYKCARSTICLIFTP